MLPYGIALEYLLPKDIACRGGSRRLWLPDIFIQHETAQMYQHQHLLKDYQE